MPVWLIPLFIMLVGLIAWEVLRHGSTIKTSLLYFIAGVLLFTLTIGIDFTVQTADTEVWSGRVVDWNHEEEWEEWHPPVTHCSTDSKGHQSCSTTPGYWEHHYAENHIKTTDDGWIYVDRLPDGKVMDDSYPNHTSELKKYWKKDSPTASVHSYVNKVQASYSVFNHKDISKKYTKFPDYPDKVNNQLYINRLIGYVPQKEKSIKELNEWNSKLGTKKQVNIIFVNVGDKPLEYALALQDHWKGGKKNDFIVAFSMGKDNKVNWSYPITWSEAEGLKLDVKEYMNSLDNVKDFSKVIKHISLMVEKDFVRKEFADFNYLNIDVSASAQVILWFIAIAVIVVRGFRKNKYNNIEYGI